MMRGSPEQLRGQELLSRGVKFPLIDIDKTLILGKNSSHFGAFNYAFKTVFGLPNASINQIIPDGMIDRQIISEVVRSNGFPVKEIPQRMPAAVDAMLTYFRIHKSEDTFASTPGAADFLTVLQREGLPLGLLTGIGFRSFFEYGAFGDQADQRVDLIPLAISRASNLLGQPESLPEKHFVIMGDSPRDVACAKAGGLEVIAVATGSYSTDQLRDAGADLVVATLEEQQKICTFLNI